MRDLAASSGWEMSLPKRDCHICYSALLSASYLGKEKKMTPLPAKEGGWSYGDATHWLKGMSLQKLRRRFEDGRHHHNFVFA